MKPLHILLAAVSAAGLTTASIVAQTPEPSAAASSATAGMPSAEDMQKMMEMSKLNENHKLLTDSVGTWSYTVKMWMNGDPSSKPDISKGTATRKAIMDGRFVVMDVTGKMDMPGPDGKMKSMTSGATCPSGSSAWLKSASGFPSISSSASD